MEKIKVFEAFAGIGTQKMALDRLRIDVEYVGISEIDKYAIKSYEIIHGTNIKNYGDISKINQQELPSFDLFTYSFPCQSISASGKLQGLAKNSGTRSSLLWECQKIIENKRPKYLLMENVKNLISKRFKPFFDLWCQELEKLGYTNYYQVLNAKDYGIPQNRERVFMISILGEHNPYIFPKPKVLNKKLKDILEKKVDEKYYLSEEILKSFVRNFNSLEKNKDKSIIALGVASKNINSQAGKVYSTEGISPTIIAGSHGYANGFIQLEGKIDITSYDALNRVYGVNGIAPTLTTMLGGHRQPKIIEEPIICASRGRNPENPNNRKAGLPTKQRLEFGTDISNCLTTVQKDNFVVEPYKIKEATKKGYQEAFEGDSVNNFRIRKLTPRECWRLMGIDDEMFDKVQQINSNTQLYKQAGNAIVVDVLEAIFKQLFKEQ